jgi:plasmid maintenance system antidote protein VapI
MGDTKAGFELLKFMKDKDIKQKDLASRLCVSQAYISAIVRGEKCMSANTAERTAVALCLNNDEKTKLHRAAALDQGFSLGLPEDF